jgi:hypothetical protein
MVCSSREHCGGFFRLEKFLRKKDLNAKRLLEVVRGKEEPLDYCNFRGGRGRERKKILLAGYSH